jgi:folate-binding protein YgfZ
MMDSTCNPISSDQPWAFPLALIQVTGAEALPFLHNLLTADLRTLAPPPGTLETSLAAFLNVQGRVVFTAVVAAANAEHVWLILPEVMRTDAIRHLSRYILRTKVRLAPWQGTIDPAPADPGQEPLPPWHGFIQAAGQGEQYHLGWPNGWVLHWAGEAPHPANTAQSTSSAWAAFHEQEMEAGVPWVLPATNGLFLPQMLNLERLGGLSMDKGCYPGQEIVARVHFRGQVKRHLYHGSAAQWLEPGTPLYAEQATAAQRDSHASGLVVYMAPHGGSWRALLVAEAPGRYCSASQSSVEANRTVAPP